MNGMIIKRFFKSLFALIGLIPLMLAALPPLSARARQEKAEQIVSGTVQDVYRREVRKGEGSNLEYVALLTVDKVEKGFWISAPVFVYVHYWQVGKRPKGWTGPQGQSAGLEPGTRVRVFSRLDELGRSQLLEPNGWEPL